MRCTSLLCAIPCLFLFSGVHAVDPCSSQAQPCAARTAQPLPPAGFTALFNGKDLTGWHGMPHFDPYKLAAMKRGGTQGPDRRSGPRTPRSTGRVENGELVNDGNGAYLTTDKEYGDIELLRRVQDGAQGRQRHLSAGHAAGADLGLHQGRRQVEPRRRQGLAAACGTTAPALPARTRSSWPTSRSASGTRFRILMVGERVTVYLNDKLVVDHARLENFWNRKLPLPPQGADPAADARRRDPLAQHVHPRDPSDRGQRDSAQQGRQGLRGRLQRQGLHRLGRADRSTTRSRTAPSSASRRRAAPSYTKAEYADFVARVEFKLPPGGNNGLAIRYPGKGDTAYVGMCEIQVLDDTANAVRQARPAPVQRLGLRHDARPIAAICGPSASGTSRK